MRQYNFWVAVILAGRSERGNKENSILGLIGGSMVGNIGRSTVEVQPNTVP
jgi:hypothetical protein